MSPKDITLEIANYLRANVRGETLVRFEEIANEIGISASEVSDNFEAAVEQAELEVINKGDMRATVDYPVTERWTPDV